MSSVKWEPPVVAKLSDDMTLYSVPPPGSGLLLAFILRVLDGYVTETDNEVEVVQRITEAFKHAYGRRTDLGDPAFYNVSQVFWVTNLDVQHLSSILHFLFL